MVINIMQNQSGSMHESNSEPYKASLTREQFLFYEMRTTARLLSDGLSDQEVRKRIVEDNLFQYPTEKSIKRMATVCMNRLKSTNDKNLIQAIAAQSVETSKQICLYAMMKHSRLVWDFMLTVIAEKYRLQDFSFGKVDLNRFFMRLQEQDDAVASWSSSTIIKLKQVLTKVLVETDYLENTKADRLNTVLLSSILEHAIRSNHDTIVLPAFHCFE